jgi:ribonucleotide reductase beta subunit family protein with ferritin-like domain
LWKYYKQHIASFWTAEEVDLSSDLSDWARLNPDERWFIGMVLAFFAGSDGIVMENLVKQFFDEVQIMEARQFYSFQIAMEAIHSETYSLLLQTYIQDDTLLDDYANAIDRFPTIQRKAEWAMRWMDTTRPFCERLVAFACVEGVFFSGSFCSIYWLKKRGLMPGLTFSNELIARDEGLHRDFACALYGYLEHKPSIDTVHTIVREAVQLESEFITACLPVRLIGMNQDHMILYIKFVADHLLDALHVPTLYNVSNPFPWMELISIPPKTNYFERRVGSYQKAGVLNNDDPFVIDDTF